MKLITKILAGLMLALMVVYATGCENNNGKNTGNSTGNNTGNTVNETVNETILVNDLGYVDLGLPSGNLWATCNIGANAPEESGDFFAWGEIEKKPTYEWLNYKHCADGERGKLTKYCPYASEGNHDFRDALIAKEKDPVLIGTLGTSREVHYIIVRQGEEFEEIPVNYEEYMRIDGFVIYKNTVVSTSV